MFEMFKSASMKATRMGTLEAVHIQQRDSHIKRPRANADCRSQTLIKLYTPIHPRTMPKAKNSESKSNGSGLDFEAQLWAAADKMRGHMDASEYKYVCLGLIFLKYISETFEEKREQLLFGFSDPKSEWFVKDDPERKEAAENRDEYLSSKESGEVCPVSTARISLN